MRLGPNVVRLGIMLSVVGGFPVLLSLLLSEIGGDTRSGGVPAIGGVLDAGPGSTSAVSITEPIEQEPISLDEAHDLIDSGQVSLIVVLASNPDEERWYELSGDATDSPARWRVVGNNVLLFAKGRPGATAIGATKQGEVGLTAMQLDALLEQVRRYNATASEPIELFDERSDLP